MLTNQLIEAEHNAVELVNKNKRTVLEKQELQEALEETEASLGLTESKVIAAV